jgi:hypothetical protein
MKFLEIINVGFEVIDQLLIIFSAFIRCLRKKWEYSDTVHHPSIDFKKAYDSVRREVMYCIVIEFGIVMKSVKLSKMCVKETYSKVFIDKHLSDIFPILNGLKEGYALSKLFSNFAVEYVIRMVEEK